MKRIGFVLGFNLIICVAVAQSSPNSGAYLEPLSNTQISSAEGCVIQGDDGRILIDNQVKIGGRLIPVHVTNITRTSKSWEGGSLSIFFQIMTGSLPETPDGDYREGKSPWGVIRLTYNGQRGDMRGREQCNGL
ncbi:MAG: hypothetical protein ACKOPC_01590 [Methylocystis sp.]